MDHRPGQPEQPPPRPSRGVRGRPAVRRPAVPRRALPQHAALDRPPGRGVTAALPSAFAHEPDHDSYRPLVLDAADPDDAATLRDLLDGPARPVIHDTIAD